MAGTVYILLFFDSKDHIDPFLDFLNDQSTSISFTKEEEKHGHIAFLDLQTQTQTTLLVTYIILHYG